MKVKAEGGRRAGGSNIDYDQIGRELEMYILCTDREPKLSMHIHYPCTRFLQSTIVDTTCRAMT